MALDSTVFTRPGTLVIAPPLQESAPQSGVRRLSQEDKNQSGNQQQGNGQAFVPPEPVLRRGNSESFASADQFRQQQSTDSVSGSQGRSAINAYQSLAIESRRDEIKQMMGVDTYA